MEITTEPTVKPAENFRQPIFNITGPQRLNPVDVDVIDEFIRGMVKSSSYHQAMIKPIDTPIIVEINSLSPIQKQILFSPLYLNLLDHPQPPTNSQLNILEFSSSLPGVSVHLSQDDFKEGNFNPAEIHIQKNPPQPLPLCAQPIINELYHDYEKRLTTLEHRQGEYAQITEKFSWEIPLRLRQKYTSAPAIQSLLLLSAYTALSTGRKLDANWIGLTENHLDKLFAQENLSPLTPIGCEVEVLLAGSTSETSLTKAKFVHLYESTELLHKFDIPTEADEQGEAALPKSRNAAVQVEMLCSLAKIGFLPVDTTGAVDFSLHVNVGIPDSFDNSQVSFLSSNDDYKNYLRGCELSYLFGVLFSTTERISHRAFTSSFNIKGEREKGTYRFEIRTLNYNPNVPSELIVNELNTIRTLTLALLNCYDTDVDPEVLETYINFGYQVKQIVNNEGYQDEDYLSFIYTKASTNPEVMSKLIQVSLDTERKLQSLLYGNKVHL